MNISFVIFSLAFFLLALLQHGQGETLEEICQKIAEPGLSFNFCMKIFQTDPKSISADLQGLGIISVKQTITKATGIKSYTQKLLDDQDSGGNEFTNPFKRCVVIYENGINLLNEVISNLESKNYHNSEFAMSSAVLVSRSCEDAFIESQTKSPLKQLNDDFHQLALIPLRIVNLLDSDI